jgi:hypothetical protein
MTPRFEYSVVTELLFDDRHFRLVSLFESDDFPLIERQKAMNIYSETRRVIDFLINNKFFKEFDTLEFSVQVFCRIGNDELCILGAGMDYDMEFLNLEYETLMTFGYINTMEPTMTVLTDDGRELIILPTDLVY